MKTKILIGVGAALLLLLNAFAFSSYGEPKPELHAGLKHCYQAFAGCHYMPGYNGYCTERTTATHCTRDYVYCTQCVMWGEGDVLVPGELIVGGIVEGWDPKATGLKAQE